MKLRYWVLVGLAGLLWMVLANIANAMPENVRLGYTGCASCHVSPTGGGALTAYGRSTSEELSTWAREGDGQFFSNLVATPEWLAVGGDARYVNINVPSVNYHRKFLMQTDVELAVHPLSYLWLAASVGSYGEEEILETRRHYLMWTPSQYWYLRFGRYMAPYGIMMSDHTLTVRSGIGWNQGSETTNAEFNLHSEIGELVVTGVVDTREESEVQIRREGYTLTTAKSGGAARATVSVGKTAQLGVSGAYMRQQEYDWALTGVFGTWGITRDLYLLAQADRRTQTAPYGLPVAPTLATYGMLGYEATRGVHVRGSVESLNDIVKYGIELQLIPVPHYEFLASAKYTGGVWTTILMCHVNI
jgi:hypothetical protein